MVLTVTTIPADELTELIGIDVDTASGLIAAVREGLPFDVFANLQHVLELPAATLADLLGLPLRTLNRRKHEGQFKPEESDALLRVARVVSRTLDLFKDRATAILWLKSPEFAFNDDTPLSLLDTEVGAQKVLRLLDQLAHGVFP
ncbi:type II RES/Xre toxin-antitoxin system antitoxin [Candidatus Entotheonella palauensis]|nr:antitoxin Xre-like helix-turn-helix domain-containing protein [Candidatus Entotheonella palauensis]